MTREEYIKKYNEEHREEIKAKAKLYYQKNKEKIKEYYKLNKEKTKEYHQNYSDEKREKLKEYNRIWYQNNKHKRKKIKQEVKERFKDYNHKTDGKLLIKEEHKRYVRNLLWLFDNNQYNVVDYYRVANVYVYYHEIKKNYEFIDDFDTETQVRIMRRKLKKMLGRR